MDSDLKNPDGALHVRFQMISVYQPYDSNNATLPDGKPNPNYTGSAVYRDVPFIEITTPGGLNRIVEAVRDDHKARFPKQWKMFEMSQGGGEQIVGARLSEWPAITRSRAEELRAMKYYTVEQIASASDAQVQGIGMDGIMLRQKAQSFLKAAKDTAALEQQNAEINKLRQEQAAKDALHEAQMKQLQEQMAALLAAREIPQAPKRRGRPPKQEVQQEAA